MHQQREGDRQREDEHQLRQRELEGVAERGQEVRVGEQPLEPGEAHEGVLPKPPMGFVVHERDDVPRRGPVEEHRELDERGQGQDQQGPVVAEPLPEGLGAFDARARLAPAGGRGR